MEQTIPATLLDAAKTFWRSFVPVWVFPVVFLFGGTTSEQLGHPLVFFWFVALPLFFWSMSRAGRLWLEGKIKYSHIAFWAFLFPFIIWVVVVFVRLIAIELIANA